MAGVQQSLQVERAGARLTDVLSSEQIVPLLDDDTLVAALLPLLPEGEQTLAGLRENVASPQYVDSGVISPPTALSHTCQVCVVANTESVGFELQ